MSRFLIRLTVFLLVVAAAGYLLFPFVSDQMLQYRNAAQIRYYRQKAEALSRTENEALLSEGLEYNGQSTIFDFKGKTLATADNEEKIIIAEFDKEALEKFRRKFPVWKDADMFEIR